MPRLQDFLSATLWNNTGQEYLTAIALFLGLFIVLKIFDITVITFLKRSATKTKNKWDDVLTDFFSAISWQFYAYISIYVASLTLQLSSRVHRTLYALLIIFIAYYVAQGLSRVVNYFTRLQIERRKLSDNQQNTSMIKVFGILFKIVIYAVAILMILANLGIEITPLLASLGIGGIAIAIALQAVLADLFAAFAIYFDKPFKEGDFIIVGDDMGTVKTIGIKTTRIQTLQGQELIVSNSYLTNSRVNNYKRMKERRVVFAFGVEYNTSLKKLKKINELVSKAISSTKLARLDRTHFKDFGDFSLNYEVVYYAETADYNKYMDIQQEINFKLKEAFEKEKIVFAFPTQTLFVEGLKNK